MINEPTSLSAPPPLSAEPPSAPPPSAPIGIYLHIPFCLHKCPYCDFNSYSTADPAQSPTSKEIQRRGFAPVEAEYIDALTAEIRSYADADWAGRCVATVFFGGGTPSLCSSESIAKVLDTLRDVFTFLPNAEITLETNPGTVQEELGRAKLEGFLAAGVNRISFGCQSFSERKLQVLGRWHTPADMQNAVENARAVGVTNINLDLIFGVQGETLEEWNNDLQSALKLSPQHISAYGLTIEPGTEFGKKAKKGVRFDSSDDLQATLFEHTLRVLSDANFPRYEVSNFAPPGCECEHNLGYWSRREYLGLGAGAHGFSLAGPRNISAAEPHENSFGYRWSNVPRPRHYVDQVKSQGHARQGIDLLDRKGALIEYLYLRLRTSAGLGFDEYQALFQLELPVEHAVIMQQLVDEKFVEICPRAVGLTERGFLFMNTVLEQWVDTL